jgi:hypothetical protein
MSISFVHSGLPSQCISPNLHVDPENDEYPGLAGTGFIARRGRKLFYITARHCLTKDQKADVGEFAARLQIPYRLNGKAQSESDYFQFEQTISLEHDSEDIPGKLIDLVILPILEPQSDKTLRHLLSRAVKLPSTGEWFDNWFNHSLTQKLVSNGIGPELFVIGYPQQGTSSGIEYPESRGKPIEIHSQAAMIHGNLGATSYPDRLKIVNVVWQNDLNGFSGSPVFLKFWNENGNQFALVGMAVTGGNQQIHFIKISVISRGIENV